MRIEDYDALIVDYGMGNLGSILNMMKRIGALSRTSSDPSEIARARRLILPGVGAFDFGMKNLAERDLVPALNRQVFENKVPFLGICLGMQVLSERSQEGVLPGLGWIQGEVVKFKATSQMRVPHMGWNVVSVQIQSCALFDDDDEERRFYFAHSYFMTCKKAENILSVTNYHGVAFVSSVQKENILGVQFHPEKSHRFGMKLFTNFLKGTASGFSRNAPESVPSNRECPRFS